MTDETVVVTPSGDLVSGSHVDIRTGERTDYYADRGDTLTSDTRPATTQQIDDARNQIGETRNECENLRKT